MMRNRQVVAFQLRNQNACLCAEGSRNVPDAIVVIRILLMKYIEKFSSSKVDALSASVVCHVIDHRCRRVTGHNLAGIRIKDNQLSGNASAQEQAMRIFVECD